MNPRNHCTVPESLSHRCSANRTGRSRVISCHSRDIGVETLYLLLNKRDVGYAKEERKEIKACSKA
jgi:hypothetical protein